MFQKGLQKLLVVVLAMLEYGSLTLWVMHNCTPIGFMQ